CTTLCTHPTTTLFPYTTLFRSNSNWNRWHTLLVLLFPVAVIGFGILLPPSLRLQNWLINLVLFLLFIIILGNGITGRWEGLLIEDRKSTRLNSSHDQISYAVFC